MLELYKRIYATLVACIDTIIDKLNDAALHEGCNKQQILDAAEELRHALLKAEEMYINGAEDEDEQ